MARKRKLPDSAYAKTETTGLFAAQPIQQEKNENEFEKIMSDYKDKDNTQVENETKEKDDIEKKIEERKKKTLEDIEKEALENKPPVPVETLFYQGKRLYQISQEILELEYLLDEKPKEAEEKLKSLAIQFKEKALDIVYLVKEWQYQEEIIDKEIKRLQKMKQALKNKQERLRQYLKENMLATGIKKILHPTIKIYLMEGKESVEVYDINLLPDEYKIIKVEPDKQKIKKALKEGKLCEIDGVRLEKGEPILVIK